jgi:hypothetical protein
MPQRNLNATPKTITKIQKVEVFAVSYVDGNQMEDTRFLARMDTGRLIMLHPEGVDDKLRPPAGWLRSEFERQMGTVAGPEIPEDQVQNLPSTPL